MTKVINVVSGPGAGKTTICSLLFANLKLNHHNAEYVQEFAKTLVWKQEFDILNNQHYVSQSQYKLVKSISGAVDYIITDGSLLHGLYYNRFNDDNMSNVEKTEKSIIKWFNEFDNIVIFLERGEFEYEQAGRIQNYKTACNIDVELEKILNEKNIVYKKIVSDIKNIDDMIEYIMK